MHRRLNEVKLAVAAIDSSTQLILCSLVMLVFEFDGMMQRVLIT